MRVLLFASLAEACGARALDLELELPASAAAVRRAAELKFPQLHGRVFRVSVNSCYATEEAMVRPDAEVAFLPPVSGG